MGLICVGLLAPALAEQHAHMSVTAVCLAVLHSMDTDAWELSRHLDCYAGCSETHVHGLTSHMHSGAAMAVSSKCGILHMPLLPPNIDPFNSIQATNDEKAPLALAFPSNGEELSPVLAACLINHDP